MLSYENYVLLGCVWLDVKYFSERKIFLVKIFSRKKNIFKCLVAFQKIFWKIFSGVWLYSWKCSRKLIFIMFLTFSQLPNKYIITSNKTQIQTQILNAQQKKNSSNQRSTQNQRTTKQEPPTTPQQQQENQRSKRASRSATRSTISGFDDRWRFLGSTIGDGFSVRDLRNGFDGAISLSLCLRIWVLASLALSLSLGIARRTSLVLGFLGSSELLDVDWSRLHRCWGASVISLPCCLSLSLLFSWGGSDLKWKWEWKLFSALSALFYDQTENIFSLTEFSVTAKHPLFQKSISGISLKPKQTEPKLLFFRTLLDWFSMWRNHPFSSILDLLDFCNVRSWFVHSCIPPVYLGVSLFLLSMNLYYLSKKIWSNF